MMHCDGLTKLIEECGELVQIAAKKQAYFDTDTHPDGKGSNEAPIGRRNGRCHGSMRLCC